MLVFSSSFLFFQIKHEEYGEAIALAKRYNLDSDLVYQRQWQANPVSVATIQDYLVRIAVFLLKKAKGERDMWGPVVYVRFDCIVSCVVTHSLMHPLSHSFSWQVLLTPSLPRSLPRSPPPLSLSLSLSLSFFGSFAFFLFSPSLCLFSLSTPTTSSLIFFCSLSHPSSLIGSLSRRQKFPSVTGF